MRAIPDPTRGCGHLVKGGFYLRSEMGRSGTLVPWAWCLGESVIGGANLSFTVPARQTQVCHMRSTLATRQFSTEDRMKGLSMVRGLADLPDFALMDHIGESNYTPYSFAMECQQYGPSRRVSRAVASRLVAENMLPIPIIFTHPQMPVVDADFKNVLALWAIDLEKPHSQTQVVPDVTCYRENWGILAKSKDCGNDHWIVPVLKYLHERNGKGKKHLTEIMPAVLAENTLFIEQAVGVSWLTNAVYVVRGDEPNDDLGNIAGSGIEPVTAE